MHDLLTKILVSKIKMSVKADDAKVQGQGINRSLRYSVLSSNHNRNLVSGYKLRPDGSHSFQSLLAVFHSIYIPHIVYGNFLQINV